MSYELNITKNVKDMDNSEKELLRLQLEKKLHEYMKENYDIFYPTFVRYPHPSMKDTVDFMIGILFNPNTYGEDIVYRTVRSYIENLSKDIKFYVETISYDRYYHDMFNDIVSKKTLPVNSKWFDVDEGTFSDKDIKVNTSVFIYKYHKLFLNVGYIEYANVHQDIARYSKRKLFPLLDFNIDKFGRLRCMYDELKNANDYISNKDYTIKQYLNALDNYINNEIDIDKLYDSLNQIEPKLLFFFNYLFYTIHFNNEKYYNCDSDYYNNLRVRIVDNDKINFSCIGRTYIDTGVYENNNINLLLSFDETTDKIEVVINCFNQINTLDFSTNGEFRDADKHIDNIMSKIHMMSIMRKNMHSNANNYFVESR